MRQVLATQPLSAPIQVGPARMVRWIWRGMRGSGRAAAISQTRRGVMWCKKTLQGMMSFRYAVGVGIQIELMFAARGGTGIFPTATAAVGGFGWCCPLARTNVLISAFWGSVKCFGAIAFFLGAATNTRMANEYANTRMAERPRIREWRAFACLRVPSRIIRCFLLRGTGANLRTANSTDLR